MAHVKMNGIVDEVFEGKKGQTYLTLFDEEAGGRIKFVIDGVAQFKPGQHLAVDVQVVGKNSSQYGQSLNHITGDFKLKQNS